MERLNILVNYLTTELMEKEDLIMKMVIII